MVAITVVFKAVSSMITFFFRQSLIHRVLEVPAGTPVDAAGLPTTTFALTSTDPLYFYDGAPNQCHLGGVLYVPSHYFKLFGGTSPLIFTRHLQHRKPTSKWRRYRRTVP